jgi:hypothetical protein
MKVTGYDKGRTQKSVRIEEVTVDVEDTELKELAMSHAGETPSSLFGSRVSRSGSVATVYLFTD